MNTNIEISHINKHFPLNKRINEAKDNRVINKLVGWEVISKPLNKA